MSKDKPFYKDTSVYVAVGVMISAFAATITATNRLCNNCISNVIFPPIACENNKYSNIAEIPNIPKDPVTYSGSTSFATLGVKSEMNQKIVQLYPQFIFRYYSVNNDDYGSSTGVKMLLDNLLTFSLSSENLSSLPANKIAIQRNIKLEEYSVASDAIVFYVKKNLQVANADKNRTPSLTVSELQGFLNGDIDKWTVVGGRKLPIKVYTRDPTYSGTAEFIQRNVAGRRGFTRRVIFVKTTSKSIELVSDLNQHDEIRIGYASASEVCNQDNIQAVLIKNQTKDINPCTNETKQSTKTNRVNTSVLEYSTDDYPEVLKRFLFVILKKDDPLSKKAGVAYCNILLSHEGKELLKKAGLIPLK